MKYVRIILLAFVVFLASLAVIGFFLPQQVNVERTIRINAPAEAVYSLISQSRRFNDWSPWAKTDPEARFTFSGPPSGVGASMAWDSENPRVGKGNWVIVEAKANKMLRVKLDFGEQGIANSYYLLDSIDPTHTAVTWGFDTDMGKNPLGRWFGLLMDKWVGKDYEAGLQNLKALLEK